MKIVVCIKQVPGTTQVEVDPVTGVLKRDGVASKMNPYDLYALEAAFELRSECGGTVTAVTMGPPQAKSILLEAVAMGADDGLLLSGREFAGSDVLSTSRALSQAVKTLGRFDVILCGKQTTDGDTAQVGSEMAEFLGLPMAGNVLSAVPSKTSVTVRRDMDTYISEEELPFPCLLCTDSAINTPRLPSYKRMKAASEDLIKVIRLKDLEDSSEKHYGLSGSPTRVERIFPPDRSSDKELFEGTPAECAEKLALMLRSKKFI